MTALQTASAERAPARVTAGPRAAARPPARRPVRRLSAVPAAAPRTQVVPTWAYSLVAGLLLSAGVIGVVALNALAAEASFQARALEADISDLTLRHDDLVAAVATLEAPARVREVARTQLGLIEPEQPGFLTLDPAHLEPDVPKARIRLDHPGAMITAQG
jgi:cell division protein FtsB